MSFTGAFFFVTIYKSKFVHITSAIKIIPSRANCCDYKEYVPSFYCAEGLLTSAICTTCGTISINGAYFSPVQSRMEPKP